MLKAADLNASWDWVRDRQRSLTPAGPSYPHINCEQQNDATGTVLDDLTTELQNEAGEHFILKLYNDTL
jgi:hypothetical protein